MSDLRVENLMYPLDAVVRATVQRGVMETLGEVSPGGIVVLEEETAIVGLLAEENLRELARRFEAAGQLHDALLASLVDSSIVPARTQARAPLADLAHAMQQDRAIRWHVVFDDEVMVGILPPITGALAISMRSGLPSRGIGTLLADRLYGGTLQPKLDVCVCCQGKQRHCMSLVEARLLPTWPRVVCKRDQTLMLPSIPCPQSTSP